MKASKLPLPHMLWRLVLALIITLSLSGLTFLTALAWLELFSSLDQPLNGPMTMAVMWMGLIVGWLASQRLCRRWGVAAARRPSRVKRWVFRGLLGGLMLWTMISHETILSAVGEFLVVTQAPKPAQIIWVLGSANAGERYAYGLDLLQRGFGQKLIVSLGVTSAPLLFRTQTLQTHEDAVRSYLISKGVSQEDFLIFKAKDTHDEALLARKYIQENNVQSALIVTSPEHTRRAQMIFNHVIGDAAELTMVAVPLEQSEFKSKWWQDRYSLGRAIYEYFGLVYYWFRYVLF